MQAVLVMFRSDGERRSFSITRDVTVIGRRDDCDLRIPLGDVSRKHARLIRDGDAVRLEDLGSSNGTFLNGQRIERDAVVQAGDSVQVGPVVFVLQVDGHPADEELNPVTADAAAGGLDVDGFGAGAALGAAGAAALGLDDDDLGVAPAADGGGGYDPLGGLDTGGEEPTLELGHAGDEGTDFLQPEAGGTGEVPIGEDPLAIDEEPLAIGEDPLALDEEPPAAGAGHGHAIPLAADDDFAIPLAGEDAGAPAHGGSPQQEPLDSGLELTDEPAAAEGGHDDGLDDLLIDIEPEPPKKR